MVGGHLGPGQAPAAGPAAGARATAGPGRLRLVRLRSPCVRARRPPSRSRWALAARRVSLRALDLDRDERRAADREPAGWTAGRPASRPSASEPPSDPRAGDEVALGRRSRGRSALREAPPDQAADQDEIAPGAGRSARASRAARPTRRSGRRRSRRKILIGAGLAVVLAGAAVAVESGVFGGGGPAHTLVTPDKLGAYVRRPQLEKQMNAAQLQRQVIAKSAGQASHVVSAVYEDGTSATSSKTPQMILFIGGNLTGVSASGFIASFTQQSKGAFVTSAGSLGGSAACVNAQASVPGSVALCTWADNDTFGVVASPTMTATRLATQLRAIRPMVEHVVR